VTKDIADSLGLKTAEGALVAEPQANGPAAKAGIEAGDVIIAVNGESVKDARDLAKKIGSIAPGTDTKLTVVRKGNERTFNLKLGEMPNQREARATFDDRDSSGTNVERLGLTLAPAGRGQDGVVVTEIDPSGAAADAGFRTGDVILEVAGKAVSTPGDVRTAVQEAQKDGRRAVLFRVKSGEATKFVALPVGRG
jgi:serine protease Do